MNGLKHRPVVLVAAAAVVITLLAIARPVLYQTAVPVDQASKDAGSTAGPVPVVSVVSLELQRLQTAADELPDSERDPFRFRPLPPPPAARVQAPPPPAFTPPVPVGPPPPRSLGLKYAGWLTIGGEQVGVFVDGRGNTFNGKQGDILEGRYRVLHIGPDSVELAFLDGRGRQSIRLTGQ